MERFLERVRDLTDQGHSFGRGAQAEKLMGLRLACCNIHPILTDGKSEQERSGRGHLGQEKASPEQKSLFGIIGCDRNANLLGPKRRQIGFTAASRWGKGRELALDLVKNPQ